MAMAILFRKESKKSPFSEALQKLIECEGEKLILSSGFFAYKTRLINWIIEAASKNKISEITIIAGYVDPNVKEDPDNPKSKVIPVKQYHKKIHEEYEELNTRLQKISTENIAERKEITEKIKEISNKHYANFHHDFLSKFLLNKSVADIISTLKEHLEGIGVPQVDYDKNVDQFWKRIEGNISENEKKKNIKCEYCKLVMFVNSLYYKLFANSIHSVPVRIVFIPETKGIKWHSKVALKVTNQNDQPKSAILGSSNLTTANLPLIDGTFFDIFAFECDIYITMSTKLELNVKDQDYSVIPVEPKNHSVEGILNSIYQGVKHFL